MMFCLAWGHAGILRVERIECNQIKLLRKNSKYQICKMLFQIKSTGYIENPEPAPFIISR